MIDGVTSQLQPLAVEQKRYVVDISGEVPEEYDTTQDIYKLYLKGTGRLHFRMFFGKVCLRNSSTKKQLRTSKT